MKNKLKLYKIKIILQSYALKRILFLKYQYISLEFHISVSIVHFLKKSLMQYSVMYILSCVLSCVLNLFNISNVSKNIRYL